MELYDYHKLNLTDGANKLWGDGILSLMQIILPYVCFFSYYCEVVFHNNEIVEIRTLKKGTLLEKYSEV
jgi:hypothetical protein